MRAAPTPPPGGPEPGMSIECRQVVELITDYLEGALDDAAQAEVEAHLALCPACAEYLTQMRTTLQLLGRVSLDTLSPVAMDRLVDAFRTAASRRA
jgi:anti-sigma factor RsiW